ncbi:MAG: BrnT family toxin [Cyanobacteria bacterium]|jgi:uncharacterized DUF497 family protein|nr:BrnT family toxin [Cyanobacteria bacterium GSL.Bin1]
MPELSFDWDESKRFKNIEKHGIDFYVASRIFWGNTIQKKTRKGGEERKIAIGKIGNDVIVVVFVERANTIRLISARPAKKYERELYRKQDPGFGRRNLES